MPIFRNRNRWTVVFKNDIAEIAFSSSGRELTPFMGEDKKQVIKTMTATGWRIVKETRHGISTILVFEHSRPGEKIH